MIEQPTNNPVTSDLPMLGPSEWLEEPTLPKKEDFKNPENYEFALTEYKHKMTVYQARLSLHKACEKLTEEQEKSPFRCMIGKAYPKYDSFIEELVCLTKTHAEI